MAESTPCLGVVLLAGSRLLDSTLDSGPVDVAIQRLLWAGVAVAILTKDDPATGGGQSVSAAEGTRVRLPSGAVVVAANDDDACVGHAVHALKLPPSAVCVSVHSHDAPSMAIDALRAASNAAGPHVVLADSFDSVEIHIARTHKDAGALLVSVYMRPSRELDLLQRGLLPLVPPVGAATPGVVFVRWNARIDPRIAPPHAILHKVTDDLATGGSACGQQDEWPACARDLSNAASTTVIVDEVPSVMRLGDRWATMDALTAAGVAVPPSARVAAGTPAVAAAAALADAGVAYPVILKPRAACGTSTSHALVVVLAPAGLAPALVAVGGGAGAAAVGATPASTTACDVLLQQYVDHGAVLHKVYVAGRAVHASQRPSLPDLGRGGTTLAAADPPNATTVPHRDADPVWVRFDSTDTQATAAVLAATAAARAATCRQPAAPAAEPVAELERAVDALRDGLGVTLFGLDAVVDGACGRLLVVDVNYFPSMTGMPSHALADVVRGAVLARRAGAGVR